MGTGLTYLLYILLLSILSCTRKVHCGTHSYNTELRWAPWRMREPFVVLMNDLWAPSWRTRNAFDKIKTEFSLKLPRGVPLGIACGACFPRTRVEVNLTMSISNHNYQSVMIPSNWRAFRQDDNSNSAKSEYKFSHGEFNCMLTYLMSVPILHEGSISCSLYRGSKPVVNTESIDFSVAWSSIEIQDPEELLTQVDGKRAELQCPEVPSSTVQSALAHVWHSSVDYDMDQDVPMSNLEYLKNSGKWGFLRSTISLPLVKSQTPVTCSVYDMKTPAVIYRTRYKVVSSAFNSPHQYTSHSLQTFHQNKDQEDVHNTSEFIPQYSYSFSTITLSIVGIVIVLIVIVVAYSSYKYAKISKG